MATTMISLHELSENAMRAVAADSTGPVIVTEEGRPAHVLLSYDAYQALIRSGSARHTSSATAGVAVPRGGSLVDALAMPGLEIIPDDFEFPKLDIRLKIPEFE